VPGVGDVEDRLIIRHPADPAAVSDEEIARRVEELLASSPDKRARAV
jgi:hypothetical protein